MLFQLLFGAGRMLTYTVHEGPTPPSDRMDRADALRFVKDGFSMPAALTAPAWLAAHQLWPALVAYLAAAGLIAAAYLWFGLPDLAAVIAMVALHLVVGFEADTIERADLEHKGWNPLGSVTGSAANECERRFFDQWLPLQPVLARRHSHTPPPEQASAPSAENRASVRGSRGAADRLAALWRSPPGRKSL